MSGAVLEIRQVSKRFGATEVIRQFSLALQPGQRLGLMGPNGAGKSTLLDLVSGHCRPDAGQLVLHGRRIDGLPPYRIHRLGLARSFQISQLFPSLSVQDNLRCALLHSQGLGWAFFRRLGAQRPLQARADEWLERLHLQGVAQTPAAHLDYAQQRTLELGLALAAEPAVLLLDEPTAGMSRTQARRMVALIDTLSSGKTLLIVEHDMHVMYGLATHLAVMVQGELLALGTVAAIRADARVQQVYLGTGAAAAQASDGLDGWGAAC